MAENTKQLDELVDLLRTYPSPHNGQPMVLVKRSENQFDICFETDRGLSAMPISYLFSFVTVGVFARFVERCAEALGHKADIQLSLPSELAMANPGLLRCGVVTFTYDVGSGDSDLRDAIRFRQTSRKKYMSGLTGPEKSSAELLAKKHGIKVAFLSPAKAHQTIWLNQRAVFDDMFDPAVRKELLHWLRFSAREKHEKKDGLSYDCMEMSGNMLRFVCRHFRVLRWPLVAPMLKSYYLRTMRDESSVGYALAAFTTPADAAKIGECVSDLWLELSRQHKYLHPFGTIVSNKQAHADFVKLAGIEGENRRENYVVFIFRAGSSPTPVRSERLNKEHFIREDTNSV